MIGGFAEYDAYAPLSIVDELALLMKQSSVRYRYEVHRSATGYALPDRDVHARPHPSAHLSRRGDFREWSKCVHSAACAA